MPAPALRSPGGSSSRGTRPARSSCDASPKSTLSHRDRVFTDLHDAYRSGAQITPPYVPKPDDTSVFFDGMTIEDEIRVEASARYHATALKQAQQGNLDLASRLLRVSKAYLTPDDLTRESYCIGLLLYSGVESYVFYRNGEFDAARASMRRSLHTMNELQEAFGYGHVDGHRIHLARNLLRLDAHGGRPMEAAEAAFQLLLYTVGIDAAWPYPELTSTAPDRSMTEQVQHMMFNQVARELVLLLIHSGDEVAEPVVERGREIVTQFPPHASSASDAYTSVPIQTLRSWLRLQELHLTMAPSDVLAQSVDFFRAGPQVPALWYGVIRDVVQLCEKTEDSPPAQHLKERLLDDAGSTEALDRVAFKALFNGS